MKGLISETRTPVLSATNENTPIQQPKVLYGRGCLFYRPFKWPAWRMTASKRKRSCRLRPQSEQFLRVWRWQTIFFLFVYRPTCLTRRFQLPRDRSYLAQIKYIADPSVCLTVYVWYLALISTCGRFGTQSDVGFNNNVKAYVMTSAYYLATGGTMEVSVSGVPGLPIVVHVSL